MSSILFALRQTEHLLWWQINAFSVRILKNFLVRPIFVFLADDTPFPGKTDSPPPDAHIKIPAQLSHSNYDVE